MINRIPRFFVVVGLVGLLVTAFVINRVTQPAVRAELPRFSQDVREPVQDIEEIYVDIKGAIRYPGVYKVTKNTRLFQLVRLAGGLTPDADVSRVNLSKMLFDQNLVVIPALTDEGTIDPTPPHEDAPTMVSISTASHEMLVTLPNIGQATANAIIAYRNEHGPFNTIEEIMRVSGIGEATFEAIKPFIMP